MAYKKGELRRKIIFLDKGQWRVICNTIENDIDADEENYRTSETKEDKVFYADRLRCLSRFRNQIPDDIFKE